MAPTRAAPSLTADRRRLDRLVAHAELAVAQIALLNATLGVDAAQARQMVLDAAVEYRRAVHALRRVARAKEVGVARRVAREYLKEVGA